jgi:hypothetical protein
MNLLAASIKKTLIVSIALSMSSCLKPDSDSESSEGLAILTLSGKVAMADGSVAANTMVFTDHDESSRIMTDENGEYKLTLRSPDLAVVSSANGRPKSSFFLIFEQNDGTRLRAISPAIETSVRGNLTIDPVTLQNPSSAEGKVIVLRDGEQQAVPAEGVHLWIGRTEVVAAHDGSFSAKDLPAGKVPVRAYLKDAADMSDSWLLTAGETKSFSQPLIMFPPTGIHGLVQFADLSATAGLPGRTPYTKSFIVRNSPLAAHFRYHHRREELETPGKINWRPIQQSFDYDFAANGGHTLYYQFSSQDQQQTSQIYAMQTIIDPLGASGGIVINDGSGFARSLDLTLKIDIPPTAFRMRIAESEVDLRNSEWRLPEPLISYSLKPYANLDIGSRTLHVQFADVNGVLSPIYSASVIVTLWPSALPPVFTINGGDPASAVRMVRLDIQVPTNAYEMQIFEAADSGSSSPLAALGIPGGGSNGGSTRNLWLAVKPQLWFKFNSAGLKTLYLQFRTADQITSPMYEQSIRIDPFQNLADGFVINGGAPVARSRHLDISLLPPHGSVQFKIGEVPGLLNQLPWLTITPNYIHSTLIEGLRTVYVAYRTIDGDESPVFSQSIFIEAFPPDAGDFVINGGDIATITPTLHIDLLPPINARYFAISEGFIPRDEDAVWREIQPNVALTVFGAGSKSVFVRYRTDDNIVSAAIQRVIFYDPFPYGTAGVVINNGAVSTTSQQVNLRIYGEINLLRMRVSNDILSISSLPFIEYRTNMTWDLPANNGLHKVYIQFETATGERSPVYFSEITKTDP